MVSERRRRSPAPPPRPPRPPRRPSYEIEFKPGAVRDLEALEQKDRRRVVAKIETLATDQRPAGVEKIRGEEDLWRVRVGNFRILYEIRDAVLLVLIVRVRNRRDVYRDL